MKEKMMRELIMVSSMAIAAIVLSSCSGSGWGNKTIEQYTYDERVDLCFGWSNNGYGDVATHVPCNNEVLALAGVTTRPVAPEARVDGLRP